ncbi:hypothetical protein [Virgibacillus ndiopensis]|uniref:hypothetical protein n=1 Tax=Virgibacillus ndiopensis TaxID=2004408 RepID=UPI000C089B1E|nr:hypothetical protein [Virgibacillus ndiopensis]
MTAEELYTSLKRLYKKLMFPEPTPLANGQVVKGREWTMAEIDQLDVHFFYELLGEDSESERDQYLSDIW